jgi:hypothetical protein
MHDACYELGPINEKNNSSFAVLTVWTLNNIMSCCCSSKSYGFAQHRNK